MKKLIFTLIFSLTTISCFSNTSEETIDKRKIDELEYVCCTRTASSGTPRTSSWNHVSVTVCERKTSNMSLHLACARAQELARLSLSAAESTNENFTF